MRTKNTGVKRARFVDVARVDADMVDAGDARALWFILRAGVKRGQWKKQTRREKDYGVLPIDSRDADEPLHADDSNL